MVATMDTEEPECCAVDKEFVPYKAHYFMLNGAHVGVIPYMFIYAKTTLGCSASMMGMLATCMQFSSTLSKPLFGLLADCLNHMKVLIATLVCLEVLVNLSMLVLPPVTMMPEPSLEETHTIRYAQARVYDSPIGFFTQMAFVPTNKRSLNETKIVNRLEQNSSNRTKFHGLNSRFLKSFENVSENATCYLRCDSLIELASCQSQIDFCLEKNSINYLSCVLMQRNSMLCPDFVASSQFTLISMNASKTNNSLEFRPHQNLTYNGSKYGKLVKELFCNVNINTCALECPDMVERCNKTETITSDKFVYHTYQFWIFCLFAVISSVCHGALYTLSDTLCYEKIRGTSTNYGRQRVWGAIGWGLVAPVNGFLNDLATNKVARIDYSSGWYIMALLSAFLLLNLICMDFPPPTTSKTVWQEAKSSLLSSAFFVMEINVFFMGILNAYAANYIIWYLESLESTKFLMGLALAVECLLGEAPFMQYSGWFINKLGHWNIVTLSFAAYGLRYVALFFIDNPWLVLPVELLNGITFGLFYPTMTSFAENLAPYGSEATVQGLLGGTFHGLGSGVGCLIAGFSFDSYGGRYSFLFAGVFSIVLAILHGLFCLLVRSHEIGRQGYTPITGSRKRCSVKYESISPQ